MLLRFLTTTHSPSHWNMQIIGKWNKEEKSLSLGSKQTLPSQSRCVPPQRPHTSDGAEEHESLRVSTRVWPAEQSGHSRGNIPHLLRTKFSSVVKKKQQSSCNFTTVIWLHDGNEARFAPWTFILLWFLLRMWLMTLWSAKPSSVDRKCFCKQSCTRTWRICQESSIDVVFIYFSV